MLGRRSIGGLFLFLIVAHSSFFVSVWPRPG
jgi:hypothetical protein